MFGGRKKLPLVTCALRVDTSSSTWQTAVRKVLNKTHGVLRFSVEDSGTVEVVGNVDTEKLVKKLAKAGVQSTFRWFRVPPRSSDGYVNLGRERDSHGTGGYYGYGFGYEYRPPPHGGIVWPGSGYCDGNYDWYRVNVYPVRHPAAAAAGSSESFAWQFR